jgi:hypothetical protein
VFTAISSSTLSVRKATVKAKTPGNPPRTWHTLRKPLPNSTKRIQPLHAVSALLSLMNSVHCSVPPTPGPTLIFSPILPISAGNLVNTLVWMPREDARAWKEGNVAVAPYFLLFLVFFLPALIATAPHTWPSHGCHAEATRSSCSAHSASFASWITGYLATCPIWTLVHAHHLFHQSHMTRWSVHSTFSINTCPCRFS